MRKEAILLVASCYLRNQAQRRPCELRGHKWKPCGLLMAFRGFKSMMMNNFICILTEL